MGEVLDPVVDWLERACVEAIQPLSAFVADVDRPDLAQDAEVFGDLGLGEAEEVDEVVDGVFAESEQIQDLAAAGFCDGVPGVGGGCGPSHADNICRYQHMSSRSEARIRARARAACW